MRDLPGSGRIAGLEHRTRPFVPMNQDMVSVERNRQIPDDAFDRAKNTIVLDDLLQT